MAGQTINDRLLAARHSIAGQGLAKSVCKATTEEMIGPKKKHLDYLIHCTNEPNVSIPQLANLLIERSQNTNWTVVFKALITVHHMLCYGNERFTQYLASSNSTFQLSNFLDKSGVQAGARVGYDMSPFIRRYAKYLNEKALSYRTVAFDFCKVKRGKEDGTLRTMNAEKLLKTLPVLQSQLDALLEFDCTANDLTNGVINMAFMLLFRDLIRLFACYNDGIINLLEKYFDMNKKQCRDALDLYKKFLIRMDRVGEFLKVAENVGIDKGDIPDLTKAPSSLLDALEQHLASLEGKKGSAANTPTQTASNRTNVKSGVSALSSTSTAFGTAASNARLEHTGNGHIDESLRQQALAEEEAAMNQYKAKVQSPSSAQSTNPFLSSPTNNANQPIVDLFGGSGPGTEPQTKKASDDLLQLAGNPFADMFGSAQPAAGQPAPGQNNMWMTTNGNGFPTTAPSNSNFVSDNSFTSVFGGQDQHSTPAGGGGGVGQQQVPNPFMADFGGALPGQQAPSSNLGLMDAENESGDLFGAGGPGGGVQTDLFSDSDQILRPDDPSQQLAGQIPGQMQQGHVQLQGKSATPPPRPPPPNGATPRSNSPAAPVAAGGQQQQPQHAAAAGNKSAFDDLNDSIRMALGGSPSRPPPPPTAAISQQHQQMQQQQQQQQQQQPMQQQQMQGFGGFGEHPGGVGMVQQFGQGAQAQFGSPVKSGTGNDGISLGMPPLMPTSTLSGDNKISAAGQPVGQTVGQPVGQQQSATGKVLTGDLDSSLASLAQNLTINKSGQQQVKGMQWNSPKNAAKTGGPAGWSPQPMAATTGAGYRPMGQGMTQLPPTTTLSFPPQTVPMGMQGMPMGMQGIQGMRPMMGGGGMPVMMAGTNPMINPTAANIQQQPTTNVANQQQQQQQQQLQQQGNSVQLDPFGAL